MSMYYRRKAFITVNRLIFTTGRIITAKIMINTVNAWAMKYEGSHATGMIGSNPMLMVAFATSPVRGIGFRKK